MPIIPKYPRHQLPCRESQACLEASRPKPRRLVPTRQLAGKRRSTRTTKPIRWKAYAAFLAFLLLTIEPAMSAEQRAVGTDICAEREILLETLVEAMATQARPNWCRRAS